MSEENRSSEKPEITDIHTDDVIRNHIDSGSRELKKITDWFDKVFVINCAHRPDRLAQFKEEVESKNLGDLSKITVFPAVIGDYTGHPAGWGAGNGAWGCLQSHRRVMEDLMHMRDDRGALAWDSALILEDDVFFLENALQDLHNFMLEVPCSWGQIYLGGQHRAKTTETGLPMVRKGGSINRTHAYAVSGEYINRVYQHISYMMDYTGDGNHKHVDHQLELAHQRGDWPVYCPVKWVCGQRAGSSNISGKTQADMTWL